MRFVNVDMEKQTVEITRENEAGDIAMHGTFNELCHYLASASKGDFGLGTSTQAMN